MLTVGFLLRAVSNEHPTSVSARPLLPVSPSRDWRNLPTNWGTLSAVCLDGAQSARVSHRIGRRASGGPGGGRRWTTEQNPTGRLPPFKFKLSLNVAPQRRGTHRITVTHTPRDASADCQCVSVETSGGTDTVTTHRHRHQEARCNAHVQRSCQPASHVEPECSRGLGAAEGVCEQHTNGSGRRV